MSHKDIEDKLETAFCVKGDIPLKCKDPVFTEFDDEINAIVVVLQYFKTYLPELLSKKKDCRGRYIKMDPKDIGVNVKKNPGDYFMLLVPSDDLSTYSDDNYAVEDYEYVFQLQMVVRDKNLEGALENLIKFKSAVKTMLINMQANLGFNTEIDSFNFGNFSFENNTYQRDGIYNFSISDRQTRPLR